MTSPDRRPLVVVMGVSGSGKTTVGRALATALDVPFADADRLHSQANIAKMSAGTPLDDDDRRPWLAAVASSQMPVNSPDALIPVTSVMVAPG